MAEFYDISDCAEELTHTEPEEAAYFALDDMPCEFWEREIKVYAYKKKPIPEERLAKAADEIFEFTLQQIDQEEILEIHRVDQDYLVNLTRQFVQDFNDNCGDIFTRSPEEDVVFSTVEFFKEHCEHWTIDEEMEAAIARLSQKEES